MKKRIKVVLICLVALIAIGVAGMTGWYLLQRNIFNDRIAELNEFSNFADDGTEIEFTFDLNRRDLYEDLIEEFGLDEITAGYNDVDLMIVLQDWVTDNFGHDGASGMPENRDAMSIINFMRENNDEGNCRLLAILLAEVLRLYGIEAKHVVGMPAEVDGYFVHVYTHAWSSDLQQWVFLDPTFNIYLQDEQNNFIDIYHLRRVYADGRQDDLVHNDSAHLPFGIWAFQYFMSDYLFRFETATHFTFGSDHGVGFSVIEGSDVSWYDRENRETSVMLVPVGFDGAQADIVTTSAEAFFAPPR